MRSRTFVIIAWTAAISVAAPKERSWEEGKLLDNRHNGYFKAQETAATEGTKPITNGSFEQINVTQNSRANTVYERYVIEGPSSAYLVETGRLGDFPAARVIVWKSIRFALGKNKLWFLDERGQEYEAKIIRAVPRPGGTVLAQEQTLAPVPAPEATAPEPKPVAKQEPIVVAKAEVKIAPAAEKKTQKQDSPAATLAQPQAAAARASANLPPAGIPRDRPWQSGQLLSTSANLLFANIPYTTETDAAAWTFVTGADGKATAFIHAASQNSSYIYDNYVIETEFCGYLVQRARLKAAPPVRFPTTKSLKFAIEKTKIWIIDEDGKEYEAKIVKQIQKDSEARTLTQTAAR
jgi:hypothetical protein